MRKLFPVLLLRQHIFIHVQSVLVEEGSFRASLVFNFSLAEIVNII